MWLMVVVGGAVALFCLLHLPVARLDSRFSLLALVTILIGSRISIKIPRVSGEITVADTLIFLTMLLYGGEAASLLAAVEALCSSLHVSRKIRVLLFNAAVLTCSTFVTYSALRLCFGQTTDLPRGEFSAGLMLAVCVMATVQYTANTGLVAVYTACKIDQPVWPTWRQYYLWTSVTYFAGATAATIIATLVHEFGFYAVVAMTPIVVVLYVTYRTYLKNIEVSIAQAEQAERHIEELNRYIKERQQAEEALHEADQRAIVEYERLLERIASLAQTLGTARDLTTIYRALLDFALVSAPCSGMFISLYEPERKLRTAVYAWSEGEEVDTSGLPPMRSTESPASRAVATGRIVITDDFQSAVAGQPVINVGLERDPRLPQSSLAVPMAVMGQVVGVVEVQSTGRGAYERGHATAMLMAANLAASAVENVRLFEREREKEEQLRQSQKMEAVGKLAGGVAHDFNNLLTVITGYSELLLKKVRDDEHLGPKVEEIKKAGERAASLTRQLLTFSRKQVLQPKVLDLNQVVLETNGLLRRLIGEDIELLTKPKPDLGKVKADPGQIEQILMNLSVNARDAMPGGGTLVIETGNAYLDENYASQHPSVTPGWHVMLTVSDTGCGMDAETKERIFEPFFTTKELGKGTGLGLSTVYGIVKQSGGHVQVYSEVGIGTTFKVYLPRADKPEEREAPVEVQSNGDKIPEGTETVLLVEDEEVVRVMARALLLESGYHVLEAGNGNEALRVSEQYGGPIHLLLTDVVMPQMGGRELAERLAGIRPETRVLYMSGYTDDAIVHHGVFEEAMAFIQKPFTPDALGRKVRRMLEDPRSVTDLDCKRLHASLPVRSAAHHMEA